MNKTAAGQTSIETNSALSTLGLSRLIWKNFPSTTEAHRIRSKAAEENKVPSETSGTMASAADFNLDLNRLTEMLGPLDFHESITKLQGVRVDGCAASESPTASRLQAAEDYIKSTWQYAACSSLFGAVVLAESKASFVKSGSSHGMSVQALGLIEKHALEDTTYIYDLAQTARLYRAWTSAMPRVVPYYAVKCNPDPVLVSFLAALGAGFDCASGPEIELVSKLNVNPEKIVFANPCKRVADIRTGKRLGVTATTFDTEFELDKISKEHPEVGLVLRIRCDDPDARVPLGLKYGADPAEARALLQGAKQRDLNVIGVSFHVGSACKNLAVYEEAIVTSRLVFDMAAEVGFTLTLLDIGGGFTGRFDEKGEVIISELAATVNAALDMHFPVESGVRVISEPGRFFAEASASLFSPIFGRRDRPVPATADSSEASVHKDYWLTDGLYGSFNCILYDDQRPAANVLRSPLLPATAPGSDDVLFKSTLWGPTCDSADFLYKDVKLPELRVGDWCHFPYAGAYTVAGACDFNGIAMTNPNKFYIFSDSVVNPPE